MMMYDSKLAIIEYLQAILNTYINTVESLALLWISNKYKRCKYLHKHISGHMMCLRNIVSKFGVFEYNSRQIIDSTTTSLKFIFYKKEYICNEHRYSKVAIIQYLQAIRTTYINTNESLPLLWVGNIYARLSSLSKYVMFSPSFLHKQLVDLILCLFHE